jgi:hypothetical protein
MNVLSISCEPRKNGEQYDRQQTITPTTENPLNLII